jgi:hypothetical protein
MYAHGSGDTTFAYPAYGQGFDDGLNIGWLQWQDVMDSQDQGATPGLISGPDTFVPQSNPMGVFGPRIFDPQPIFVGDGPLAKQRANIQASFTTASFLAFEERWLGNPIPNTPIPGSSHSEVSGLSPSMAWWLTNEQLKMAAQDTPYIMEANPISWSCLFKPCAGNGPFGGVYAIIVSPLVVPQGINLEAPSSP